jgi:hypothetical protein
MRLVSLINYTAALLVVLNANTLLADTPYKMDPNNPSQTRAAVRHKIVEICHKLNAPRLNTNEKRQQAAKNISAAFPYRPDKVHIYSRRIKGVVLEAKIIIPFLYKMEVKDEPFQPGGIGIPIKEKAVYLYTIQVEYDVPADANFDCDAGFLQQKQAGASTPSLRKTIDKAFDTLQEGHPKIVETAPFPQLPRIAVFIQNIPP